MYTIDFQNIANYPVASVGGKGANLVMLSKIDDLLVPDGFCVTTEAFREVTENIQDFHSLLSRLISIEKDDLRVITETSEQIRKLIEETPIPDKIEKEIVLGIKKLGIQNAYAIRSSATAEDLPSASFAGQQDTYLNIMGAKEIVQHVSKCWASLFTDRAVMYRIRNGFDQQKISLAVVIQKMVFPDVAGVMFTADPVTSNRQIVSIDASYGLGEALVSGLVTADNYKVREGVLTDKVISEKKLAIYANDGGGTNQLEIVTEKQTKQALTDEQILTLEKLGRKIEANFFYPQDIEWCLSGGKFYIVQSRPITTLYPIPEVHDHQKHVYVSVGHQQMMTDAMKPLGLSYFLSMTMAPMRIAGGRLFVDITPMLGSPAGRQKLMDTLGKSEPLIKDALMTIMEREGFIKFQTFDHPDKKITTPATSAQADKEKEQTEIPAHAVSDLIKEIEISLNKLKQEILTKSGTELFDFITNDIAELRRVLFNPESMRIITAAMEASSWINENMYLWLGEKNAADTLSHSVPNNITSQMGLALLDVADVIRPFPAIIKWLQQVREDNFLEDLDKFDGGLQVKKAIEIFLDKYGMRCAGEIDVTRTRWIEKPATLLPMLLNNIKNCAPEAGIQKFEQGRTEAAKMTIDLLERLKQLPDGEQKIIETKKRIDIIRNFIGYREYPKYGIVNRSFVYRQALIKEAEMLVEGKIISEKDDVYYLTLEEFREAVAEKKFDQDLLNKRKEEYKSFERLTPPRMITSDGEIISGTYKKEDLPAGAIAGLAVSSGIVEGRARVILDMEKADLAEGDILVTSFTDPSWTPLFVSIKGLITEVGGIMTHGAVVAREYGLPAIVGVENATRLIKDGQKIRLNGTDGYVEIL